MFPFKRRRRDTEKYQQLEAVFVSWGLSFICEMSAQSLLMFEALTVVFTKTDIVKIATQS